MNLRKKTTTTPKTTIFQTNFDNTNFERSRTSSLITTPPPPPPSLPAPFFLHLSGSERYQ